MTATSGASARRRPSQARSEATVAAILTAARALLHDDQPLTARSIAQRADIAAPTVYRYFVDVDAIVDALVVEHATAAESMVGEVLAADAGDDIATTFRRVLDGYLRFYDERPELTLVWRSADMAERQRRIEAESDHGLAVRLTAHLVAGGAISRRRAAAAERRIDTYWQMAGVALGAVLHAPDRSGRSRALADLRAFVDHAAERCTDAAAPRR